MMGLFLHFSKKELGWIPGDPVRRALYMNIVVWLVIGCGIGALAGSLFQRPGEELVLMMCNLGGGFALGPGLIGGLYWWLNHDE
ncbi:MAG TPA: hypothetical protein IAA51_12170 [Candidatus Cottocaccamicrobium excrementipullorum]|nr:hypothetical protein [Candidatus Cottocaccamicrobium excrementipullorum]